MCVRISWWQKNTSNLTIGMWSQINMTSTGFFGAKSTYFRHPNESESHPPWPPTESANVPTASYRISKFFAFYVKAMTIDATYIFQPVLYPKDLWRDLQDIWYWHVNLCVWVCLKCKFRDHSSTQNIWLRHRVKVGSSPQKVNMNPERNLKHVCCTMFRLDLSVSVYFSRVSCPKDL